MTIQNDYTNKIEQAILIRESDIAEPYQTAFRLINGFTEGLGDVIVEIFAKTLVYHDYSDIDDEQDEESLSNLDTMLSVIRDKLPWLNCGILKKRRSKDAQERNGSIIFGSKPDKIINENGIRYAIDLMLNRDASFYLDTKNLRQWLTENMQEKRVLNTFAYTGSLGIAALMGGASEVIQLDLNHNFLEIGKRSSVLNEKKVNKSHYQNADFWSRINQYKKRENMFDCVILDPPVFSKTPKGTIDAANHYDKIINKVRPIILNGGYLVCINNALYQSGEAHQEVLKGLGKGGYLSIDKIIDVPDSCIGKATELATKLPVDPAPYNHSTKITILKVKKK
jgi:23S rRNA (cytosine1962-C5)-methyltransferase